MQFQIPQFIETEDKIVGPFSLRQVIYIGAAGAIVFMLYFFVQTWLWAIISMVAVAAAIALAFLKINGRRLSDMLLSALSFYWKPQTYVWRPEEPTARKEDALKSLGGEGFLENLVSGIALKNTFKNLQVGPKQKPPEREVKGRYEIFQRLSGERQVARRIDYR